jgi:ribosomal protein S18 acetylase RimI-like enzyme
MVELALMTPAEFERYMASAVRNYADAHIKAGDCDASEALALAKADYDALLPDGLNTPGQHLLSVRVVGEEESVGMIWFALRDRRGRRSAYIYDVGIDERHRGKGHAAQALKLAEAMAAAMGAERISLNVMGWNHAARALYEKAGFKVTGIGMTKLLDPAAS